MNECCLQVLLCLENEVRNGSHIAPDCEVELMEHRKMLMEDYRLSPEIVGNCAKEITSFCSGIEIGGRTIHCLMDHVRIKNIKKRIGPLCERVVRTCMFFVYTCVSKIYCTYGRVVTNGSRLIVIMWKNILNEHLTFY